MHTLQLPLATTASDACELESRFRACSHVHNVAVKRARKSLYQWNHAKDCVLTRQAYRDQKKTVSDIRTAIREQLQSTITDKEQLKSSVDADPHVVSETVKLHMIAAKLNELKKSLGLTEYALQSYTRKQGLLFSRKLSSAQVQKEVSRVWKGVDKVLKGQAKYVHFKRQCDLNTLPGKNPTNGIRYYDAKHTDAYPKSVIPCFDREIEYLGLHIKVKADMTNPYIAESLDHPVKYCEIKRLVFSSKTKYYVILYLDGPAPKKMRPGHEVVGIDPGVSSVAVTGENACTLEELAPHAKSYRKEIARLQKKVDRSKQLSNPENYNAGGTCKKGKHKWEYSKRCMRNIRKITVLYRKQTETTKCTHHNLANRIIMQCGCGTLRIEKMDFPALARRSKQLSRQDKKSLIRQKDGSTKAVHKFKRRKRFGVSVGNRAPASFIDTLKQKQLQYGGAFLEIQTKSIKASQLNHGTGKYEKIPLSQRSKSIDGHEVQRDLYSSFLIQHVAADGKTVDLDGCKRDFQAFLRKQQACIDTLKQQNISMPQCFGF